MLRAIKRLAGTLVVLFFMTGCQAMTGQTMGETIDDSYITGAVKTQLASDKMVSLTRVEVETNNGVVYLTGQVQTAEQRSRIGSLASQVKGVKKVVNNLQVIKN
ncbi:MAG TPA: BON domain-containing protein [Candidatus Nitrosocosmicus sp.]|jgi:hyperosmotically inducible periplasmic protein|nr:BON domain-containing protein [Candidatus Nitrosocosmicus sp.]